MPVIRLIVLWGVVQANAYGLVPVESLLLGDFSSQYKNERDPLNYLNFNYQTEKKLNDKKLLSFYRGFYQEGENLKLFCERAEPVRYSTPQHRAQVIRSLTATIQYIGLDLTMRALSAYAHFFEFDHEEFQNMSSHLVGNYCSKNMTSISLKQLKKNFQLMYEQNNFKLPEIPSDDLFPKELAQMDTLENRRRREMASTAMAFRAFCSWGQDEANLRLLVPFLRHPSFFRHIVRQMLGQKIVYDEERNVLTKHEKENVSIGCRDFICRKVTREGLESLLAKSLGSQGLESDLNRLYCTDLKLRDYQFKFQEPKILSIQKRLTFDETYLMLGQVVALLTGVPDFMLWSGTYAGIKQIASVGFNRFFNHWAKNQLLKLGKDLMYEESLSIELIERKAPLLRRPEFTISFDVNMGEFDRVNQSIGKIKSHLFLELSQQYLMWLKQEWGKSLLTSKRIAWIREGLEKRIASTISEAKDRVQLPPWKGNIAPLVAQELLSQLAVYNGEELKLHPQKMNKIKIEFAYAPLAINYMRFLNEIRNQQKQKFESLIGGFAQP